MELKAGEYYNYRYGVYNDIFQIREIIGGIVKFFDFTDKEIVTFSVETVRTDPVTFKHIPYYDTKLYKVLND